VLAHVVINQPDSVCPSIRGAAVIQIDAMFEVNGAGDTGAVIGHVSPVALDQSGAEELGGGVDDSGSCGGGRRRFLYRRDLEAGGWYARHRVPAQPTSVISATVVRSA